MTTTSVPVTQADLIDRLLIQESKYFAATELIERLGTAPSLSDPARQKDVLALQRILAEIRATAAEVTTAVSAYTAAGNPRSAQLDQALKQQEDNLKSFLARIDGLQQSFSGSRFELRRQLDDKAARRSMHQAYRQSMKTS